MTLRRMTHDPNIYPHPYDFRPERFDGRDLEMRKLTELVFGFGRRTCPGSQFAEGSLFAIAATILATSNIVPKRDAQGCEILPEMEYTSGMIVCVLKYMACIHAQNSLIILTLLRFPKNVIYLSILSHCKRCPNFVRLRTISSFGMVAGRAA